MGDWQSLKCYRFPIAEAQGAMIDGKNLFIVAGFLSRFKRVTRKTFSLDTSRPRAIWRRRDNHPREGGTTHAGFVVVNNIFYMCGGYLGGHPGQHTDGCYSFDISKPRRSQWTSFASLPDDGRAGGGLFYDSTANALFFAAGAKRLDGITIDYNNTWMYSLDDGNPNASGWISKAPSPFVGNHVGFVTAYDATGKERHYIVGGQTGEDEANGNRVENYEYDVGNNVWIPRQSMLIPRGHAASSTRSVGCGYIVAAGTSNGERMISDVSYYDIPTDTWTSIGSLPKAIKTPVCDFATNSEGNTNLYCETGYDQAWFSHKIQVLV